MAGRRGAGAADVVVSAFGATRTGGDRREYLADLANLAGSLGGTRLIVVGGAGSLIVDGVRLADSPDSPAGGAISAEDYAVALLDEVEKPVHRGRQFTVAN